MTDTLRKLGFLFIAMILFLSSFSISGVKFVHAEEEENSTNNMTRSMVQFFQQERTSLAVDRVAKDELIIYGIFLSNFYKPWSTKISDIIDNSSDNSFPKQLSNRFFGSSGRSEEFVEINKKLYDAITKTMSEDKKRFSMYAKPPTTASTPLSGKELYKKINGADEDSKIYGQNGKVYMDLKDPATRASMQILFGIEPDMWTAGDKGLKKITEMYIDGFGNIWGAYDGASVNDYVLILPAVLNPRVYATNGSTKFRFPVANTFVTGASLKINEQFIVANKNTFMTPYYNVPNQSKSQYDKNNLVQVYGVYSPSDYIGRSDDIITKEVKENIFTKYVKSFRDESVDTLKSKKNARIIVSVNADRVKSYVYENLKKDSYDEGKKYNFLKYFLSSSVLTLEDVADEMYFFDNPNASTQYKAYDPTLGNFTDVNDLITPTQLFTIPKGANGFKFHTNSSIDSPFLTFHKEYAEEGDKILANWGINTSSSHVKYLKNFLKEGTWGTKSGKEIRKAMQLLGDNITMFDMLEPSKNVSKVSVSRTRDEVIASSLTDKDLYATYASAKPGWFQKYDTVKSRAPYTLDRDYGTLTDSIEKDADIYSLSAYFHNFMSYRIFGMNATFAGMLTGTPADSGGFKNPWGKTFNTDTSIMDGANNYAGMYWGLMVELLKVKAGEDGKLTVTETFRNTYLPDMEIDTLGGSVDLNEVLGTAGLVASEDKTIEEMTRDIVKKVYGLLQPEHSPYRNNLIKSFQESWVISTHRAIVGSWSDNLDVSVNSKGYSSSVNLISMPSLKDLPLTDWLLYDYIYIYIFLMLIVLILLTFMFITNRRTLGEAVLVLLFLAFVLILPQFLVNNVLQSSNKVVDSIFSEKFDYWAIVQHQYSENAMTNVLSTGSDLDETIANSMQNSKNVYSNDPGVRVKWMSPKKQDEFQRIFNTSTADDNLLANLRIFRWLFNSYFNQEEYDHSNPLATYVYRPYVAIAREAQNNYSSLLEKETRPREILDRILLEQSTMLGLPEYRFKLYKNNGSDIRYPEELRKRLEQVKPYPFHLNVTGLDNYRYWVLGHSEITEAIFRTDYTTDAGLSRVVDTSDPYYQAFLLHTESPFYYFYNVLKTRYAHDGTRFKDSLLKKEVFTVVSEDPEINGKMRDFLDMEGLFTYVIPYLHQANEYVYGWTDIYGKSIQGYDFSSGNAPTIEENMTKFEKERAQKLAEQFKTEEEKKRNLEQVWMMYTPWVDGLYNIPWSHNGEARVADKKVYIKDAINPGSYEDEGRQMIFSEADMRAKAYRYSDLTDIERRIQAVLDKTYKDFMYLLNYYNFDDEVLITAGAMAATFNFNAEFSSNTLLGQGVMLYPQNYEVKNFNYDAFMRLILAHSTGEPITATNGQDLYVTVVSKTSIFTGIMLIICDLLGVFVIPMMKVLAVALLLALTLALCLSAVLTPPERIVQTVLKQVGLPLLWLFASNIAFAWLVGVFMGDGSEMYVGSKSASLGISDPTITMLLLIIIDFVYIYILYIICRDLVRSIKSYTISLFFSSGELLTQVGGKITTTLRQVVGTRLSPNRHSELVGGMRDTARSNPSNGATSSLGGNKIYGGDGLPPLVNQSDMLGNQNNSKLSSAETRKQLKDIDKLATEPKKGTYVNSPKNTLSRGIRTVGNKYVDFKIGMAKTKFKLAEGKDYITQGHLKEDINKLVSDSKVKLAETKDTIKSGITKPYHDIAEATSQVRQYELDKKQKLREQIQDSPYASEKTKLKQINSLNSGYYNSSDVEQSVKTRREYIKSKYNLD